ncbi:unnamed protein product, partial [Rotaria socialis]
VYERFNKIICDPTVTSCLIMRRYFSDDSIYPSSGSVVDRFCLPISAKSRHEIKWISLESASFEHILLVANYPNLYTLSL